MFKVNNRNSRTKLLMLFWCFYCSIGTYFTPFSSVFVVGFEQMSGLLSTANINSLSNELFECV